MSAQATMTKIIVLQNTARDKDRISVALVMIGAIVASAAGHLSPFCQQYAGRAYANGRVSKRTVNHSPAIHGLGGKMSRERKGTRFVKPTSPKILALSEN
jgi:hypothetical protein